MIKTLDLLQGKIGIPEGFAVAIGKTLSLLGTAAYFSFELEQSYWFCLKEIRAKWILPTGAGVGISIPKISIFRDHGDRAYQQGGISGSAIDLQNLTTPGEVATVNQIRVRPAVPMNLLFPPGSILKTRIDGYTASDPAALDLIYLGRYIHQPGGI